MKKTIIILISLSMVFYPFSALAATEKFLTNYTEVDTNNILTVTDPKITINGADLNQLAYVYKDFGANYFDALNVKWEGMVGSGSQDYGQDYPVAFTNTILTPGGYYSASATDLFCGFGKWPADYRVTIFRGVGLCSDWFTGLNGSTTYYFLLQRTVGSDGVALLTYTDSARTDLIDTSSCLGYGTTKWRYAYGVFTGYYDLTGRDFYGFVQNMDLQEAGAAAPAPEMRVIIIE